MPKKINEELEKLIRTIERFPQGISIEELSNLLTVAISRRTLQYRLSNLVKSGILKVEGTGRSSKYVIKENLDKTLESAETIQTASIIPLSQEGKKIQSIISVPIQLRHHVSYRREEHSGEIEEAGVFGEQ